MIALVKNLSRHILVILIGLLLLAAALSTRLSSWEDMSGMSSNGAGRTAVVDYIEYYSYLPARIENDFNGHFTGRAQLVHANYWFRMNVLGERDFHDVLVGKDGWLFYTGEHNMDYYQGAELMSDDQIDNLLPRLKKTRDGLAARGIAFYVIVAPDKESIYPEYLPDDVHVINKDRLLDRILNTKQAMDLNIIDLRPALLNAKADGQVYYRTDTHWNPEGAFAAYQEIAGKLKIDFPDMQVNSISDFEPAPEIISGDLAGMLTMQGSLSENSIELNPLFKRRVVTELTENTDVRNSSGGDPSLPKAMIFHDSFFNGLQPFLMECFSEATLVHSFHVDMDWVEDEQPDVVILEIAERYLPEL